jgi:hypothetical protein
MKSVQNRSKIGPVFHSSASTGQRETETLPKLYQNFTEFSFFTSDVTDGQQRGWNNGALGQRALPGR